MNMNAQAYDQYRKATVETVSPGKLLLMLYDGAIKFVNNAIESIKNKDYNNAHTYIIKTQDIIVELMSTLNMDYEISKNLNSLYEFLLNQLIEANIKKDIEILQEVGAFLTDLKDTWQEAVKQSNSYIPKDQKTASFSVKG